MYKLKKEKLLLIILYVLATNIAFSQNTINEKPMYGNIPKTESMKNSDNEFIQNVIATAGTREKGYNYFLNKAWELLYSGDIESSMKRFNQCWLLDPERSETYWGFGILLGAQNDFDGSITMLEKSLKLDNTNYRVMVDLAYSYTLYYRLNNVKEESDYLNKAITLYEKAFKYEDPFFELYNNWAVTLMTQEKYKEALDKLQQAIKLGFKPDKEFIQELKLKL